MADPMTPERQAEIEAIARTLLAAVATNPVAATMPQARQARAVLELAAEVDRLNKVVEVLGRQLQAGALDTVDVAKQARAADPVIAEMVSMVGGDVARHYASRLRAALGLADPDPCRCCACQQDGGEGK